MALHEETLIDHRVGRIMNANISLNIMCASEPRDIHAHQGYLVSTSPPTANPLGHQGLPARSAIVAASRRQLRTRYYHALGSPRARTYRLRSISYGNCSRQEISIGQRFVAAHKDITG